MRESVFVYGSLRKGLRNHWAIKQESGVKSLGLYKTTEKFYMFSLRNLQWPFVSRNPLFLEKGCKATNITGELFEISPSHLVKLDELEVHPEEYIRRIVQIRNKDEGGLETAYIYLLENEKIIEEMNNSWHSYIPVEDGDWATFISRSKIQL